MKIKEIQTHMIFSVIFSATHNLFKSCTNITDAVFSSSLPCVSMCGTTTVDLESYFLCLLLLYLFLNRHFYKFLICKYFFPFECALLLCK